MDFTTGFTILLEEILLDQDHPMKAPIYLIIIVLTTFAIQSAAQHPLIGTWEMMSGRGVNAEGEAFSFDTTSVKETKIITPTHYMLIAWDVEGDSLIFNRTMAGQLRLEGEKYIETPTQASVQIFDDVRVGFTWKLEGDYFTQSGTIIRPDGKKVVLDALVFRRVKSVKSHDDNRAIGTWKLASGQYITADGKGNTTFRAADPTLLIATPTHWMQMVHKNKKFDGVRYGTYTMAGDSIYTNLVYSSYPFTKGAGSRLKQRVNGKTLELATTAKTPDGKPAVSKLFYEKQ